MNFEGGESIFQTCQVCNAPIVIPSDIFYPKDRQILSENFATLTNDIAVDPEQVTNELTPGDSLPLEKELIDREAKIERFEVYQEKIGTSPLSVKKAIDNLVNPGEHAEVNIKGNTFLEISVENEANSAIERIKEKLESGERVSAVKMFREEFGTGLEEAYESIKLMEIGEPVDVAKFLED